MAFEIRNATKTKSKLRLGLCSTAGGGKTYGSLLLAAGMLGTTDMRGKVCVIDTEAGSADLYSDDFKYDTGKIEEPYTVDKYIDGIDTCESNGYEIIIIDSLTHAWAGTGGLLDKVGDIQRNTTNKMSAWRDVTPLHNKLIDAMLNSKCHIIATMRSKTEWVMEPDEKGRITPVKKGLAPVQRVGMDYEFTAVLDIDQKTHIASASKDRTHVFDGHSGVIDKKMGKKLMDWLNSGADHAPEPVVVSHAQPPTPRNREPRDDQPPSGPVEDLF